MTNPTPTPERTQKIPSENIDRLTTVLWHTATQLMDLCDRIQADGSKIRFYRSLLASIAALALILYLIASSPGFPYRPSVGLISTLAFLGLLWIFHAFAEMNRCKARADLSRTAATRLQTRFEKAIRTASQFHEHFVVDPTQLISLNAALTNAEAALFYWQHLQKGLNGDKRETDEN